MSHLFVKNRTWNLCQGDFTDGFFTLPAPCFKRNSVCLIAGHIAACLFLGLTD